MFFSKYCKISKNTYFEEHLRTAAFACYFVMHVVNDADNFVIDANSSDYVKYRNFNEFPAVEILWKDAVSVGFRAIRYYNITPNCLKSIYHY